MENKKRTLIGTAITMTTVVTAAFSATVSFFVQLGWQKWWKRRVERQKNKSEDN